VVFDTWVSQGLTLNGLEIKTSRSDIRRELMQPQKSADFYEHIDTFSLVAPAEIIDLGELPRNWGVYVPDESGSLRTVRGPRYLHVGGRDRSSMSRSFVAAFTRALVQRSQVLS